MNSRLTYHCQMKNWELVKHFSSPQTAYIEGWNIICNYHKKNQLPNCKTIKTVEVGIHRYNYLFSVSCSDSLLELVHIKKWYYTAIHTLIYLSFIFISCLGFFSFTYSGFFGGLLGISFCVLLISLEMSLRKRAYYIIDKYINTFIIKQ